MKERKDKRVKAVRPVYVEGFEEGTYSAISLDFSKGGLCMVTNLDLQPGQTFKLYSDHLWWKETVDAKAVWRKPVVAQSNKVGFSLSARTKR